MADFEVPENPEYTEKIRMFETTDLGHADVFNPVVQALVNNDAFLRAAVETKAEGDFIPETDKGAAGGVATLDGSGKVPKEQLSLTPKDIGALPHIRLADRADLNRVLAPGIYYVRDGVNAATDSTNLIVMEGETDCINQIAFSDAAVFDVHMRVRLANGNWTEWKNMSDYFLSQKEKGQQGGVATLNSSDGKIPKTQLPAAADMCVSRLGRAGNTDEPMTFHYTGKEGQPQWVWGGDEAGGQNMYVWNPAAFNVHRSDCMATLNAEGQSHGDDFALVCQYNHLNDGIFHMYIEGHPEHKIKADMATEDSLGRKIAATYLPVSGGEMSGALYMSDNYIILSNNEEGEYAALRGVHTGDVRLVSSVAYGGTLYGYEILFQNGLQATGNGNPIQTLQFFPGGNGNCNLGISSYRWKQLYAASSTISTSDRNLKKDIKALTPKHLEFFLKLQPVSFAFIDGSSGRTHIGFIAQDIEVAMAECGLTNMDFAGFCKDIKTIRKTVTNEDGTQTELEEPVLDEDGNPVYIYSLRYEEFIALNTYAIQTVMARLGSLEERIKNIEGRYT